MDLKPPEKFVRKGSLGRMTRSPRFRMNSEQKTHVNDQSRTSNGKIKVFNAENDAAMLEIGRVTSLKRMYEKNDKLREKTPPPAKPPRKDQIFKVEFEKTNGQDLGLIVDSGGMPVSNGSVSTLDNGNVGRNRLKSDSYIGINGGTRLYTGNVVKVVLIKDSSLAQKNGAIQVSDEIVEVNGWSLEKETVSSAR